MTTLPVLSDKFLLKKVNKNANFTGKLKKKQLQNAIFYITAEIYEYILYMADKNIYWNVKHISICLGDIFAYWNDSQQ